MNHSQYPMGISNVHWMHPQYPFQIHYFRQKKTCNFKWVENGGWNYELFLWKAGFGKATLYASLLLSSQDSIRDCFFLKANWLLSPNGGPPPANINIRVLEARRDYSWCCWALFLALFSKRKFTDGTTDSRSMDSMEIHPRKFGAETVVKFSQEVVHYDDVSKTKLPLSSCGPPQRWLGLPGSPFPLAQMKCNGHRS